MKGKSLTDLEGPLQAAALYLFAEIDPSLKPQADRISGGFVFKKTVLSGVPLNSNESAIGSAALSVPKYIPPPTSQVNFGNVNVEALQAYNQAVKWEKRGDDESISAQKRIKQWKKVKRMFKGKGAEASARIKA